MRPARLHVIDGTYELFRAFYSKRPEHRSRDGQDVKATVGLMSSWLTLLQNEAEAVTHVGAAFDNPIESFRNDLFAGYKTGAGLPPELTAQFDLVEEGVAALGVTVWSMKQWEADDALATAAARFADQVDQVRILSPDKDLGQCIRGEQVVLVARHQEKVIDEATFVKERGFAPRLVPDFLALVGDTADGIPGIPGWGEKGTAAVLARYGGLEQIPRKFLDWDKKLRGAEKLCGALCAEEQEVALYRKLATLVTDVPLKETLEDLRWKGVPRARFEAFCDRMDASTLKARPMRWAE
ncbi:MAG TPA: 5'-3' exonuclease H3TH domain-containing protein [Myxococcales bacterium]|nr:5'-3' exonuclease H3TH domain-containing protein [Myxococcales bacterium]